MKKFFTVIILISLAINVARGFNPQTQLQELDAYYQQVLSDWDLPGMSIGIISNGELIFSKGYGVIETGGNISPDGNTLFSVASNTKAFTAAIIAMLVDEGKLSWDDKVKDHIPYFSLYDTWVSNNVTVRDLLCHRVGLGTFSGDVIWYKSDLSAEQIIKRIRHLPQAYDFRSGYGYSNLMYITAGELISRLTGMSWEENLQTRILDPLGMDRSVVRTEELTAKGNYATPHARTDDRNIPIQWVDWENVAATGGIISSINDMARWMIFNMNHGVIDNDTLISRQSHNLIWTPHNSFVVDHSRSNDFNRNFRSYGLGWGISDFYGHLSVGHTGGYDGMISEVRMLPGEKIGVIVLTNGVMSPINAITNYTLETLLGKQPRDWSQETLPRALNRQQEDQRITAIRNARQTGTSPTIPMQEYTGTYFSEIYGNIYINFSNDHLSLEFEHSEGLSASLRHWHYDVWQIIWDEPQAWFGFGTIQFNLDNKLQVISMDINVPNNDIFFEELKPVKISNQIKF